MFVDFTRECHAYLVQNRVESQFPDLTEVVGQTSRDSPDTRNIYLQLGVSRIP